MMVASRENRSYFISAMVCVVLGWIVFKYFYPYPNLIFDSYFYIKAAALHQNVNAWPIGYSKMMEVFNLFSHSSFLFITLQYLALQGASILFFFTWRLIFEPGRLLSNILFVALFANPLIFYCCNYVMADAPFTAISLLWLTQLIWIIHKPKPYMLLTQAVLLLVAFTVRYNALYFPVISLLAYFFCRLKLLYKIAGITVTAILLLVFVLFTREQSAKITGETQFSAFGGWKLANNALYMYGNVVDDDSLPAPSEYRQLDSVVKAYFRLRPHMDDILKPDRTSGSGFMFYFNAPLVQYLNLVDSSKEAPFNTRKWMAIAPYYGSYGVYLIKRYPGEFVRYFVFRNCIRYLIPPTENMGTDVSFDFSYNLAGPFVYKVFRLNELKTDRSLIKLNNQICAVYPYLFLCIHLIFILSLAVSIFYFRLGQLKLVNAQAFYLLGALVVVDFLFSVVSAAIVLRYEIFVGIVEVAFSAVALKRYFSVNKI